MFVYIWKDSSGVPFYVGLTKNVGRTNPKNGGGRNWLCRAKLQEIGSDNVVVEIRHVNTPEDGKNLEQKLINDFGRVQLGTGPLTNLKEGGGWHTNMSDEGKMKLSKLLSDPNHPIRSPEARAKHKERMLDPEVRARFSGDNNAAKKPEVREKIKAKWADPEFRKKVLSSRIGSKRDLSESTKEKLRNNLKNNAAMKGWGERNGKDPEFEAKRIVGLKASQDRRLEKMSDPEALAQRKARLKATLNSPEFKEKRKQFMTPEYKEKLSEAKRLYWAKRKGLL